MMWPSICLVSRMSFLQHGATFVGAPHRSIRSLFGFWYRLNLLVSKGYDRG